ncbi:glycosyltransferase family 4 protein [Limnohabitans sp. G3-2]|uniref:glycosyltransferase family 4 protein n=1 Tax=Limnohabitans sp. G3-2 TaxID=1100711 RepID=UPI000C1F5C8A|nr:glycosyltransferase family 4 protein [Limnohabitans sp. G3-2]PIT73899.1 glycosyltransferase WbuB [Limnohabitans sp. G3-2]
MRLLIVSQYFWPENFRINDLAIEFARRGHEVTVLTGLPNYPSGKIFKDFLDNAENFTALENIKIIRVPLIPRGSGAVRLFLNYLSFAINACVLGPWKLKSERFDVVLTCQLSPVTVGLPGAFLAWFKNAPMAMWVLDLWPDTLKAMGVVKSPRLLSVVGKLVTFIYNRCDLIFAQSQSFIPKIKKSMDKNTAVVYFPSWAEEIFKSHKAIPAPEVPDKDGSFNVMFAGNIGEAQDFECILSAATLLKQHSSIRWLIVGDGRMSAWVASQIALRGLEGHVLLLGRYPVERMPDFYAKADAMLVTLADQEIFAMTIPGKLQSYLAAGMPVIAALNGEGAEVIRLANAGLTSPAGNAAELASMVRKMAELPNSERQAMGKNGMEFSQQAFDRKKIVDLAEKYLSGLCK